jgi:hypothetical protein
MHSSVASVCPVLLASTRMLTDQWAQCNSAESMHACTAVCALLLKHDKTIHTVTVLIDCIVFTIPVVSDLPLFSPPCLLYVVVVCLRVQNDSMIESPVSIRSLQS